MNFKIIKSLAAHALTNCSSFEWSLQGFGMLRLYMPDGCRLNVWDSKYRVPNVSMIHTHPWHFKSLIVAGQLHNQRYAIAQRAYLSHACALIKPGIGGGKLEEMESVALIVRESEYISAGELYQQQADEIHMSLPSDGCITFNIRERIAADEARVFWPVGEQWVDAVPRIATADEVKDICGRALKGL